MTCSAAGQAAGSEDLHLELGAGGDTPAQRFHLAQREGEFVVDEPAPLPGRFAPHLGQMRAACAAFAEARRQAGEPATPPPQRAPEWFDPSPLFLRAIRSAGETDYELHFVDTHDDTRVLVRSKVIPLQRGDYETLGVETRAAKEIYHRLPLRPINAALVALHKLRLALDTAM